MVPEWFKARGYRHFDAAVGSGFAFKSLDADFVQQHSWSPLISSVRQEKRYKPPAKGGKGRGKTVLKDRTIMYASHRDACILSRYASDLTTKLDAAYQEADLSEAVVAYRKLGLSNYHFAARALNFARDNPGYVALCFDVTGFFDHLDHGILKRRLATLLGQNGLPPDWYAVFKSVTKFRHVPMAALKAVPTIASRLEEKSRAPLATVSELHAAGITIEKNPNTFGVPQGTPISAVLSNLYMWDVDANMLAACTSVGALYQRYSDDILLICAPGDEEKLVDELKALISALRLEIKDEKTERVIIDPAKPDAFQYLGFNLSFDGAVIRPRSLGRQWRKAKRKLRRTENTGRAAIAAGTADRIYTRKLRRRFLPVGVRNFSSYARRSAKALGSKKILKQVRRFERMIEASIKDLKP